MSHKGFEDNSRDELSGIGINEILLKIVSCNGNNQEDNTTVILMCSRNLISYYTFKGFVIPKNIP